MLKEGTVETAVGALEEVLQDKLILIDNVNSLRLQHGQSV